jgi:hypothetical protein
MSREDLVPPIPWSGHTPRFASQGNVDFSKGMALEVHECSSRNTPSWIHRITAREMTGQTHLPSLAVE